MRQRPRFLWAEDTLGMCKGIIWMMWRWDLGVTRGSGFGTPGLPALPGLCQGSTAEPDTAPHLTGSCAQRQSGQTPQKDPGLSQGWIQTLPSTVPPPGTAVSRGLV